MCWWLWTSLNTCPWRTCASFVGPSSTRRDMLWPFSLTTGRMGTLDSGNLGWGTWRVSETWKCGGLAARKKIILLSISPLPSDTCILQETEVPQEPGSCVFSEGFVGTSLCFGFTKVLLSIMIKDWPWESWQERIWNKNSCWKGMWTFFCVLISWACWFPCDPWLLHVCCFRCWVFSAKLP